MRAIHAAALVAALAVGCGGGDHGAPGAGAPSRIPVDVLADTGRGGRLRIQTPALPSDSAERAPAGAAVWMAQVTPLRPARIDPPLPSPDPAVPSAEIASPPPLEVDPGLKPPILRSAGALIVPRGARRASVELDVRVGEDGAVSDALWAGGSADSSLVAAAVRCALDMRFFPALQAGRPVAVWCRQRFDFGAR